MGRAVFDHALRAFLNQCRRALLDHDGCMGHRQFELRCALRPDRSQEAALHRWPDHQPGIVGGSDLPAQAALRIAGSAHAEHWIFWREFHSEFCFRQGIRLGEVGGYGLGHYQYGRYSRPHVYATFGRHHS